MSPPLIDYGAARFWMDILHWIALIGLAIFAYLRTKDNDNSTAVAKVGQELLDFINASNVSNHEQNNRLTRMEERILHMPNDEEIGKIRSEVSAMNSQVEGMAHLLQRVEHQTNLIHEHLLRGK